MYYIYLLKLSNNTYYTGFTDNIRARLEKHKKGGVLSTKPFRPVELISFTGFKSKTSALKFEKYLKTGSGMAFRNRHLK